jgi:hypothetical protein
MRLHIPAQLLLVYFILDQLRLLILASIAIALQAGFRRFAPKSSFVQRFSPEAQFCAANFTNMLQKSHIISMNERVEKVGMS